MIKFSISFKLSEIHVAESPFNESPKKCNLFQGGRNFGKEHPENVGKTAITGTSIVIKPG